MLNIADYRENLKKQNDKKAKKHSVTVQIFMELTADLRGPEIVRCGESLAAELQCCRPVWSSGCCQAFQGFFIQRDEVYPQSCAVCLSE